MGHLSLVLLGTCEISRDGMPLSGFRTQKVRALLVYLIVHAERAQNREALATLLWPEQGEEAALTYLRQALVNLRSVLNEAMAEVPVLLITRENVRINPACSITFDVAMFRALLAECGRHQHRRVVTCSACARRREQAVALYGGGFLHQFYLRDSPAFEDWMALTREALHHEAVAALWQLGLYYERRGNWEALERVARRQLVLDSWREEAHQQLMQALALSGQRSAALEQYERCRSILDAELGVEPSTETDALYQQIRAEQLQAQDTPLRMLGLPHPTTSFVGREAEHTALMDLLTTRHCQLVTLLGPPGIGKTRLSVEVAAALAGDFADGVVFVPLATLLDPALVVPAIAAALRLPEVASEPLLETLKRAMNTRNLLLVLDNFEQVVEAAGIIGEILAQASEVVMLVTSRSVLHIGGEHEFVVPPLAMPDPRQAPTAEQLKQSAAVTLFMARAQAVKLDFQLTNMNVQVVTEICARLDGLPLAIELAAARVKLLSLDTLLARLVQRLPLLTSRTRDLPVRQRTLRAAIDWSYQLLDVNEQALFAKLGMFVGSWTVEAAVAVCGVDGDPNIDVLNGLHSLLDKSLLTRREVPDNEPRFSFLETIHEYAREHLAANRESHVLRERHAAYYLAFVEEQARMAWGSGRKQWLEHLYAEHENVLAALKWLLVEVQHPDDMHPPDDVLSNQALRLCVAMADFWRIAFPNEGRRWLEDSLAAAQSASLPLRQKALTSLGWIIMEQGDHARARVNFEEALTLARTFDDVWTLGETLRGTGGVALWQGDIGQAASYFEESLTLARNVQDPLGQLFALWCLSDAAYLDKDYERATARLAESSLLAEDQDLLWGRAMVLQGLGRISHRQGDSRQASQQYKECLMIVQAHGELWLGVHVLEAIAGSTAALGRPSSATKLLGAVDTARRSGNAPPSSAAMYVDSDSVVVSIRQQLDDQEFAAAWAEGQAMTLEQAIAFALDESAEL